ncbi:Dna2/Cas4 domain-containing protein [Halorussus salilacus]|uniref:CRISPR-associated protein Cas4 n=1 Tax=Halorussus salilacus TaxID=2953750 RepID=UPI00209DCDA2|nr:Dna2/Cas4 domain-containing protein [Halorussus salilacus]USZ66826.1 Dna2/Cas4 domain-containing protein [Halorussus salilacus]
MSKIPFSELSTAAYCPRKLYYQRRGEVEVPDEVAARRDLAFAYDDLLGAADSDLRAAPISVPPGEFRANLDRARSRFADEWDAIRDPTDRDRLVEGRECRGVVHKVVALDAPTPSMVFTGAPPEQGVWEPQTVRTVAAAKALSWEHEEAVERAFVEYPAHGTVREVELTTRRKAAYRTAVEAVRSLDGPPPRLRNDAKCESCEYRAECGVKTRSLRSLLGL